MSGVFLKILNASIAASWLILAVLLLRPLLKKAPRRLLCLLWALAALRLVLPFSVKCPVSLVPSAATVKVSAEAPGKVELDTGISALDTAIASTAEKAEAPSGTAGEAPAAQPGEAPSTADTPTAASPAPRKLGVMDILPIVWAVGAAGLAVYGLVSWALLRRRVRASVEEGGVRFCDEVKSPFILGVFRPRIYVPSALGGKDLDIVLSHERAHIARGDHIWKPLGFIILCLHWFNPLVWAGYALFCRDVETACDERVIRDMEREERARYSETLMRLASPRTAISACPVAFGEVSVKDRVKNVLSYKKPAFWVLIAGAALLVTLGVVFLTDPVKTEDARAYCVLENGKEYRVDLSEAAAKKLSKLVSKKRLKESGRRMGGYRIMLGKRELSYDANAGTLYEPAKLRYAVLDEKTRQSVNDILGVGCVTETINPSGSRYGIRPLLVLTGGDTPRIEIEASTSEEIDVPYYACLFREAADGASPVWLAALSRNFGSFYIFKGSAKMVFDLAPELIAEAGTYLLCMYDVYDPEYLEVHAITEPSGRYVRFTVGAGHEPEPTIRLYKDAETLKNDCPDYAKLDTKNGIDVYVYQLARGHYGCFLLPGGSSLDTMELMMYAEGGRILTVEDARTLIASYGVPDEKVRIIGWYNPLSSYLYNIDPAYNAMLRAMFFPDEGGSETPSPEDDGAPKAYSNNAGARLTVVAWDLGDGAHYAEGYSAGAVTLGEAPSIAVVWENIGDTDLEYGTPLALEYLYDSGDSIIVKDNSAYHLPLFVVSPGGARTEVYSLSGFDIKEHGKFRLWLSVSFNSDGEITPKTYYVDLEF